MGLKLGSSKLNRYKYFPSTKEELIKLLKERLELDKNADLNDIDVSKVTDMSELFYNIDVHSPLMDKWDVSDVTNMAAMFASCINFNSDISGWNVSNVEDFRYTFYKCENFDQDISKWNMKKAKNISHIFDGCKKLSCDLTNLRYRIKSPFNKLKAFNDCQNATVPEE